MANIQDYIDWRGDLTFSVVPFNEVDALILTQIAYINFDGLLADSDFSSQIALKDLAAVLSSSEDFKERCDTGVLINKKTVPFFLDVAKSQRFCDVRITGYRSVIDLQAEEQFAAMTFILPSSAFFVSYRGTDDTIVGWKEDFNLATQDEVPAQKDAVSYLETAAANLKGEFYVGGHSKGGNLAIYASYSASESVKNRIIKIYNNDGPGFNEEKIKTKEFESIVSKIRSFYPQFSVVGMIFSNAGKYEVVESDETGIMQHDPFSWHLKRNDFITLEKFDRGSRFFKDTFNAWISELETKDRELLIDTIFNVIEATDARTNSEIEANALKNSVKIISAINKLDPELRKKFDKIIRELFKVAHKKLPRIDQFIRAEGLIPRRLHRNKGY